MNEEKVNSKKEQPERLLCPLSFHAEDGDYCMLDRCAVYDRAWKQCGFLSLAAMMTSLVTNTRDIHNALANDLPYMHTRGGDPIR